VREVITGRERQHRLGTSWPLAPDRPGPEAGLDGRRGWCVLPSGCGGDRGPGGGVSGLPEASRAQPITEPSGFVMPARGWHSPCPGCHSCHPRHARREPARCVQAECRSGDRRQGMATRRLGTTPRMPHARLALGWVSAISLSQKGVFDLCLSALDGFLSRCARRYRINMRPDTALIHDLFCCNSLKYRVTRKMQLPLRQPREREEKIWIWLVRDGRRRCCPVHRAQWCVLVVSPRVSLSCRNPPLCVRG
jgi:hypothetical protein